MARFCGKHPFASNIQVIYMKDTYEWNDYFNLPDILLYFAIDLSAWSVRFLAVHIPVHKYTTR